jgi:hypothetical protein
MGESKRTQPAKSAAIIERLNSRTQQLYLAVAEIAVYRAMAGPLDPMLYQSVMGKLQNKEFTDIDDFFTEVTLAAKARMLELDAAQEQQAADSLAAMRAEAIQSHAEGHTEGTSSPDAED